MNIIFIAIVFFIFGAVTSTIISLFIASIGKINEEHECYHEGFIDGYNKAKEEIK